MGESAGSSRRNGLIRALQRFHSGTTTPILRRVERRIREEPQTVCLVVRIPVSLCFWVLVVQD